MNIVLAFWIVVLGGIVGIVSAPVYLSGRSILAWGLLISAFGSVLGGSVLMMGGV